MYWLILLMILPRLSKGHVNVDVSVNAKVLTCRCWSSGQPSLNQSKHFLKRGRSRRKLLWKSCKVSFWAHGRNFISFDKFSRPCYPAREFFLSRFDSNRHSDEAALRWDILVVLYVGMIFSAAVHIIWTGYLFWSIQTPWYQRFVRPEPNRTKIINSAGHKGRKQSDEPVFTKCNTCICSLR